MIPINKVRSEMAVISGKASVSKSDVQRFHLLSEALKYLELEPREAFVEKQLAEVDEKILKYKKARLPIECKLPDVRKQLLKQLNADSDIKILRKQRLMLLYILDEQGATINGNAPA